MKITGLNALISDIEKYKEDTVKEIKGVIEDTATDVEIDAIRNAPQFIRSKIDKIFSNGGLTVVIGVQGADPLPAYFEFGTGLSAKSILAPYPQWVKDIAMQFYVNGQGVLRGKPFLYPALLKAQVQFEKDIQEVLDKNRKI